MGIYAGCPRAIVWPVDVRIGVPRVEGGLTSRTIYGQLHGFNSRFIAVSPRGTPAQPVALMVAPKQKIATSDENDRENILSTAAVTSVVKYLSR